MQHFKLIITGILSIAAGFGAGYLTAKTKLEQAYNQDLQTIAKAYKRGPDVRKFTSRINDIIMSGENDDQKVADIYQLYTEMVTPEIEIEESKSVTVSTSPLGSHQQYTKILTNYSNPPLSTITVGKTTMNEFVEENEEWYEDEEESDGYDDGFEYDYYEDAVEEADGPYLIDYTEYTDDDTQDKIDVFYYRIDNVFCTDDDDIIDEPMKQFGEEAINKLIRHQMVFVRNEATEADYEIHALNMSYKKEVGSRIETPFERKMRQTARTKEFMDIEQYPDLEVEPDEE